jgi:hypothetical protein
LENFWVKSGDGLFISWMERHWGTKLGYTPEEAHFLARGWLGFIFRSEEDVVSVLKEVWFMDRSYLSIKPWNPLFDAKEESMSSTLVWIKLSRDPHGILDKASIMGHW